MQQHNSVRRHLPDDGGAVEPHLPVHHERGPAHGVLQDLGAVSADLGGPPRSRQGRPLRQKQVTCQGQVGGPFKTQTAQLFEICSGLFQMKNSQKVSKQPKILCWYEWVRSFRTSSSFFRVSETQYSSDIMQKFE